MGTKSKDIDLLGQLFSNKDLMTRIMNGEVEEDEITSLLKNEDKTTPEYVVKEVLKDNQIKYFKRGFIFSTAGYGNYKMTGSISL